MRRVLLVFEPPDGGVAENVAQLALGLAAHGWAAAVAGPPDALPYARLEAAGVPVFRLELARGHGRSDRDLAALRSLGRLVRTGGYDLVHGHAAKAGALTRVVARATGTPALYSPHCFGFVGDRSPAVRRAVVLAERALARLGASILCVCEDERELALRTRIAPPERLHVVHNGCPPCAAAEPDPLREPGGGPLVGAVSVLRRQKRLDILVDAVPRVLACVPDARFAIVGSGPCEQALRTQVGRLRLGDRLTLQPFAPPAARHLRALDVHVLPSAWEAFPIGVLEAMACGVAQVATDVGGTREALTPDVGTLVAPGDPAALANAISALLLDPARRDAMAAAARERHRDRFAVERMVAGTAAVYERAAGRATVSRRGPDFQAA